MKIDLLKKLPQFKHRQFCELSVLKNEIHPNSKSLELTSQVIIESNLS